MREARLAVDLERSERGPQRRKTADGRLLHCCCICGHLAPWGIGWSHYSSIKEEEDGTPIPKFCSETCRAKGGPDASNVTEAMKAAARESEWRAPLAAYREMTESEKYEAATAEQQSRIRRPSKEP